MVALLSSLSPVVLFLSGLMYLDSYKLVNFRSILVTIAIGGAAALLSLAINSWLLRDHDIEFVTFARYIAPWVEESIKVLFVVYLIHANKIGFMVDAAIRGFAIGAGFSMVENLYYLYTTPEASAFLWIVRGFGTALMHGATTATVGVVAKALVDRYGWNVRAYIPGFLIAVTIHTLFNHFFFSPSVSAILMIAVLPLVFLVVFSVSERSTQQWLGVGFDSDRNLLEMITTGTLSDTPVGKYLTTLEDRFSGTVVADMLCYLRIHCELSITAKGILLMREAGFAVEADSEARGHLTELRFLEKSIGKTGKLALLPFLHKSQKDLWQMTLLTTK